jgi:hypothetical protein
MQFYSFTLVKFETKGYLDVEKVNKNHMYELYLSVNKLGYLFKKLMNLT